MTLFDFYVPVSWFELAKRTVRETMKDNVLGLAAQLAYYFFLALFPALLFLVALASFFPVANLTDQMMQTLGRVAPQDVLKILRDQLVAISESKDGGLLTLGILGTIWSSSAGVLAIVDTLNRAYDIEEGRPWWKVRLIALGLTVALAVFIIVSFGLVVAGPELAEHFADTMGLGHAVALVWKVIQWPIVFALVVTGVGLIYYFAPDADQSFVWITPGSVLATVLWLLISLAFRYYVTNFGTYNETYGTIGGIIVLLLWFYITGVAVLVGAELSAEIEHASPQGKDPGEKVPGEKDGAKPPARSGGKAAKVRRKIGRLARTAS